MYYSEKLADANLKRCYDIAPPRIQQYLEAEIKYIFRHLSPSNVVHELGCGLKTAAAILHKLVLPLDA